MSTINKILAIIGPTASGKTKLTLEIARHYPIEVISLDSALIYQNMDIGTAKPTPEELNSVPHHLIDIITPLERYNVANFISDCSKLIIDINRKDKIALIVGGNMMYYNALVEGLHTLPPADNNIRCEIQAKKIRIGTAGLYQELLQIDSLTANRIRSTDSQRIERALEVFYISNKPMSAFFNYKQKSKKNIPTIALLPKNRIDLHQQIKKRFLYMLANGFVDEVINLKNKYVDLDLSYPSVRCVGYRQIWEHLNHRYSKNEMIEKGIAATCQLAKRQCTWLKKISPEIIINPCRSLQDNLNVIKRYLNKSQLSQ